MAVTIDDLLDQLAEDEIRKPQVQIYFNSATNWIKNAVISESRDDAFFDIDKVQPIMDVAILSYSMDLWLHRSETMPPSTAVGHMIGQLRGLYSSWREEQDGQDVQTE